MEVLTEREKLSQAKRQDEEYLHKLCESFIKGQGTIYVLEQGNKTKTDDEIISNGPNYVEHAWNPRPMMKANVALFLNASGGTHHIYPKFQEYAIISAVSASLLPDGMLANYQSHEFPNITFNDSDNGSVYIVNGHHRIAAWKTVNKELLDQLHSYEHILKGGFSVANDHDTTPIVNARDRIREIKEKLFMQGGWGAIVLDYGRFYGNIHQFYE